MINKTVTRSLSDYNQVMFTPNQICETLMVPPSTLRRWARVFVDHLSPQKGKNRHRSYTKEDLNTFRKIRDLLADGLTYEGVKQNLDIVEKPEDQTKDLATLPDIVQSLQIASDHLATMQTKLDQQDQRIKDLEGWISLPWYKRITTKPPNSQ